MRNKIPIENTKSEPLSEPLKLILSLIEKNKYITKEQLQKQSNLSRSTITRYIQRLKEQKQIQRVGSDKTGYWSVQ